MKKVECYSVYTVSDLCAWLTEFINKHDPSYILGIVKSHPQSSYQVFYIENKDNDNDLNLL